MTTAYARGLLDYSKLELDSPRTIFLENLVINEIEKEGYQQLLSMRYLTHAIRQTIITRTEEGVEYHRKQIEQANSVYEIFGSLVLPWLKWNTGQIDEKSSKIKEAEELAKRWEAMFGKLSDPNVQATLKKYEEANKKQK